jgi:hypothetical protein
LADTRSTPTPDDESVGPASAPQTGNQPDRGPAWGRLEDQIHWYDANSTKNKNWFTGLKIVQLIGAAAVPVMASVHAAVWVTGGLGALVVVVEGIQQLGQFQANWINYRSTAEALKHEKFLFVSDAGLYEVADDPRRLLAERVEGLISQEHSLWTVGRDQAARRHRETHDAQDG